MNKIRVLLVDDAVVVRRVVADALAEDPELEVVGAAPEGRAALARLEAARPDLVILDLEMPEMDGLQTLAALRKSHPHLPVLMFSTQTQRGAAATLEALALGAKDYVTKPANVGGILAARQRIRDQLIPKIKFFGRRKGSLPGTRPGPGVAALAPATPLPLPRPNPLARVEAVVVGVSTGGPNTLAKWLPELPADFPAAILVVQHMPPVFTRMLAERLAGVSRLPVVEAAAGEAVRPGKVWVAPGDYHLALARERGGVVTRLDQGPPENSCRPAADVLFRSAAEAYGAGVLALVLTGMGQDGLRGCTAVRAAGGQVLAQDEASSVVWGMPGHVARAGLADKVLPLDQLAREVVRRATGERPA